MNKCNYNHSLSTKEHMFIILELLNLDPHYAYIENVFI